MAQVCPMYTISMYSGSWINLYVTADEVVNWGINILGYLNSTPINEAHYKNKIPKF